MYKSLSGIFRRKGSADMQKDGSTPLREAMNFAEMRGSGATTDDIHEIFSGGAEIRNAVSISDVWRKLAKKPSDLLNGIRCAWECRQADYPRGGVCNSFYIGKR